MALPSRITYSNNRDHNGSYLVYVNGLEVPTESLRVKYGVWQIPEATLEFAPDPVLQRLGAEDRLQVAAFFIDDFLLTQSGQEAIPRLLMEGEITGWGSSQSKGRLNYTFPVVNQIAIFTQLFVQFLTNVDDMAGHAVDIAQGVAGIAPTQSEIVFPYSLFTQGLIGTERIKRPFEILYNLVINMTGTNVPEEQRSVPVANFFTRWARLTNFINRFVATPVFEDASGSDHVFPILKALQTTSALDVLTRALIPYTQQLQNAGSMWDMLQLIFQTMFMEICMIPTAPLVKVDLKTSMIEPTAFKDHLVSNNSGQTRALRSPDPLHPHRLLNYFTKPQFVFGLPPACNVIFPSMLEMFQYNENYATQATRLYFNDEVINRLFKVRGQLDPAILNALATAYPPEANIFQKAKQSNLKGTGKNFLLFPEEFFKGPVLDRRSLPTWLYFLKQAEDTTKGQQKDATSSDQIPQPTSPFSYIQDSNPTIYELYAEYEYYRERYSRRAGAAVCKFNPFIIPGFPSVIFDNEITKTYIFCYVTSVEHVLTAKSVQTTVSYAYGRTIPEVFDLLRKEFAEGSTAFAVGPRDPIKEVRDVIQHFKSAEDFYQALLFGKMPSNPQDASFQWFKVIGYKNITGEETPEKIFIDGTNDSLVDTYNDAVRADEHLLQLIIPLNTLLQQVKAEIDNATTDITRINALKVKTSIDDAQLKQATDTIVTATQTQKDLTQQVTELNAKRAELLPTLNNNDIKNKRISHNLSPNREIVPLPNFEAAFKSYDAAMQYAWRPICSLDEYLIFFNSAGENTIPAFGTPLSIGATYYERIRKLKPMPEDFKLPVGADGITPAIQQAINPNISQSTDGGNINTQSAAASVPGLGADFPQSRANWDAALLAYRNNVYNVKVPRG